ncbi:hypothetical protein ACHAXR_009768 [Thalassiosira sp. AJA248-18]
MAEIDADIMTTPSPPPAAEEEPMAVTRTIRSDNNTVHNHFLPPGFTSCQNDHVLCPACSSTLILKAVPTPNTNNNTQDRINKAIRRALDADIHLHAATGVGSRDAVQEKNDYLTSSLESAHTANMLLQALSFDAVTRNSDGKRDLEPTQLANGVPYCPECKVHVITSAEELEMLFDEFDNEEEGEEGSGGNNNMEWLRGSLLVAVDDAEVGALKSRQGGQQQFSEPIIDEGGKYASSPLAPNLQQQHQDANNNKPKRPIEFEYDYRHKVATQTMANRISRGYTLLEEMCPECEMPLMKLKNRKNECVVCPKLLKKIARYHPHGMDGGGAQRYVDSNEQISAIIAEARSEAPKNQTNRTRRVVQPDIAEAKQYVMQRRIMGDAPASPMKKSMKNHQTSGGAGETGSHGTESLTDHSGEMLMGDEHHLPASAAAMQSIDWEELLINGRSILSKRLNEGWSLSSTNCSGANCKGTPLLTSSQSDDKHHDGNDDHINDHCVVCGGSGSGQDGAYERELEWQIKAAEIAKQAERDAIPNWDELAKNGRALLAERLKQGWTMSSDNCCGYHCNEMPLTNFYDGGQTSCVVCGGSGNGCDGAYENYKPDEVVEEERALVSRELSRLLSMGWVLREALCEQCLMPLVAEEDCHGLGGGGGDDLCILCGHLPENQQNDHFDDYDVAAAAAAADSYTEDSYINEFLLDDEVVSQYSIIDDDEIVYNEAVYEPVAAVGDSNTDDAGRKLMAGWILPDAGLCHHCHGIQMTPPNSHEIGCINRGCPSALAAAYTFLPEPHQSTGPVKLVGRGFSDRNRVEEEEDAEVYEEEYEEWNVEYEEEEYLDHQVQNEALHYDNELEAEHYIMPPSPIHDDLPLEVGGHHPHQRGGGYDEPSVLSDDLTQVRSVASSALGVILVRLDDAKYQLETMMREGGGNADPQECAEKQVEIAMLIEKLASAAVRMNEME